MMFSKVSGFTGAFENTAARKCHYISDIQEIQQIFKKKNCFYVYVL